MGNWNSLRELEDALSIPELNELVKAKAEATKSEHDFQAMINGRQLKAQGSSSEREDPLQAAARRVAEKKYGKEAVEKHTKDNDVSDLKEDGFVKHRIQRDG